MSKIKVLGLTEVGTRGSTSIIPDIIEMFKMKPDDEILWILDDKNNVIIRKSIENVTHDQYGHLYPGQKRTLQETTTQINALEYDEIIIARNLATLIPGKKAWKITIPKEIRDIISIPPADRILWILDEKGDIIIRNPILSDICSRYTINKDIYSIIIYSTNIAKNSVTALPKDIRDILGINTDSLIYYNIDENDNLTITKDSGIWPIKIYGKLEKNTSIYLPKDIRDIIKVNKDDKILWIFDEKNIIIRDSFLSDICLNE